MTRPKRLGPINIPGVPPCLSRTRLLEHIRRTWLLNKYKMKRKYKGRKETWDDFEKRVGMKRTGSDAKKTGTKPPNDILVQRMYPTASGRFTVNSAQPTRPSTKTNSAYYQTKSAQYLPIPKTWHEILVHT